MTPNQKRIADWTLFAINVAFIAIPILVVIFG